MGLVPKREVDHLMKIHLSLTLIFGALTSSFTLAQEKGSTDFYAYRPADIECVVVAAEKQRVPANVLLALSSIETGKNGQSVKNSNGTLDLGHFQINTIHWKANGTFANFPAITQTDATWRGCYNAELAAYLLRQVLSADNKQDFWTRAANYHSHTQKYNEIYKKKLIPLSVKWGEYLQKENMKVAISYK